jgi:aspartate racemase
MKYKTIGILGGMGPEATAELYLQIVRIFQKEYGAKYDDDFPEIVIINLPIPDVVENPTAEEEVRKMLVDGVKKLEAAGSDFIAIPCNTVMYYLKEMQDAVSIPILSILEETAKEVRKQEFSKIGVLGTEMTVSKNIYGDVLSNKELIYPTLEEQKKTTKVIMNILIGEKKTEDKNFLLGVVEGLKLRGAEKVILGCTELPLLISGEDFFDTIEILAEAVVRNAVE